MTDDTTIRPPLDRYRFDLIVARVCEHFKVSRAQLLSATRGALHVGCARHALYALSYELTSATSREVAIVCNRFDHSTVLYGVEQTRTWKAKKPAYYKAMQAARAALADVQ